MKFGMFRLAWKGVKRGAEIIDGVMQAKEVYDFVQDMKHRAEVIDSNAYDQ